MSRKRIKKQDAPYMEQKYKDRKKFDAKEEPQSSKTAERGSFQTPVTYGESENDYL